MSERAERPAKKRMSFFERYLTLWVALCIIAGTVIGSRFPGVVDALSAYTYAEISLPIAVLIWLMIFPMMLQIDFASVRRVGEKRQGLVVTTVVNWLIKPFTMFGIAWLFFNVIFADLITPELAQQYLAGAVLLGAAPCTAMVFVWSYLADGDPAYTLVQVAVNDLIMLVAFVPIVSLLLGIGGVPVPWDTMALSVVLFVVVPLTAGYFTRKTLIARKGLRWFEQSFLPRFGPVTIVALLATLVAIFIFQGEIILDNPLHILLIAIPLSIQTFLIFAIAYGWAWKWRIEHPIAAPAGFIGASNFFELAVAVAIALFGLTSGAALATVVGVLVEVPLMLSLVWIANRTRGAFPERAARPAQGEPSATVVRVGRGMRTPAGTECGYYYEDLHRGAERRECRAARAARSLPWRPSDCGRCPVPEILLRSGGPDFGVRTAIRALPFGLARSVRVECWCERHLLEVAEPLEGCPACRAEAEELLRRASQTGETTSD